MFEDPKHKNTQISIRLAQSEIDKLKTLHWNYWANVRYAYDGTTMDLGEGSGVGGLGVGAGATGGGATGGEATKGGATEGEVIGGVGTGGGATGEGATGEVRIRDFVYGVDPQTGDAIHPITREDVAVMVEKMMEERKLRYQQAELREAQELGDAAANLPPPSLGYYFRALTTADLAMDTMDTPVEGLDSSQDLNWSVLSPRPPRLSV